MEYKRFLTYPSLDAGSVIKYFLDKKEYTCKQLSDISGIPPQRISDFINNRRRISAANSLKLETALGIDIRGYFYHIQANHDIYLAKLNDPHYIPDLSKIKPIIFWDSDITKIDWDSNRKHVIKRIFEYGDESAINEIIHFYGADEVKANLKQITDKRLAARREQNIIKYL